MNVLKLSQGERQLRWTSCRTSAGRVTLAGGSTFLHINTLARLTGTTLGVASVTEYQLKSKGLKQKFVSRNWNLTSQNTLWSKYQGKLNERGTSVHFIIPKRLWIFMKVNFDSACREIVFTYKHLLKLSQVEDYLGYPSPYNLGLRAGWSLPLF